MRISSALLPLLAATIHHTCSAFTTIIRSSPSQQIATAQLPSSSSKRTTISSSQLNVATSSSTDTAVGKPGTADLPWGELGFEFRPTKSHLRMVYRDGKWGEAELVEVSVLYYIIAGCISRFHVCPKFYCFWYVFFANKLIIKSHLLISQHTTSYSHPI